MKILYVTDLHGGKEKYDLLLPLAKRHGVNAVINGGDMLPQIGLQEDFLRGYLDRHFRSFDYEGIYYLCCLGNDDLKVNDPSFEKLCSKYELACNLAMERIVLRGYEFIGMNLVVDYPFLLKDRCRRDTAGFVFPRQFGDGILSSVDGFQKIDDWIKYALALPTIEEELRNLPRPKNPSKTVYVTHMPPANLGLDVCHTQEKVGSKAIYDFLSREQPLISLHGHIHESPQMTNTWKASVGRTICVQPGQRCDYLTYVVLNLETMEIELFKEKFDMTIRN